MKFTIPLEPVTKKNHQQIRVNRRTGKRFVAQSDKYRLYEDACVLLISPQERRNIDYPVNIKALYYMPSHRRVDLINLHSALHDILTKAGVIKDDNANIVVSTDGSRVLYDKDHPRTEVEITRL